MAEGRGPTPPPRTAAPTRGSTHGARRSDKALFRLRTAYTRAAPPPPPALLALPRLKVRCAVQSSSPRPPGPARPHWAGPGPEEQPHTRSGPARPPAAPLTWRLPGSGNARPPPGPCSNPSPSRPPELPERPVPAPRAAGPPFSAHRALRRQGALQPAAALRAPGARREGRTVVTATRGCRPPTVFTVVNGNAGVAARGHLYLNVLKSGVMGCAGPALPHQGPLAALPQR